MRCQYCATVERLREVKKHVKVVVDTSVNSRRAAEVGGRPGPAKIGGGAEGVSPFDLSCIFFALAATIVLQAQAQGFNNASGMRHGETAM